jgi:hypothetical protein
MTTIQILVRVIQTFFTELPGPIAQGKRFVFSDNLVLERYDDSTPGSGLPQNQNQGSRHAIRIRDRRPSRCGKRSLLSGQQPAVQLEGTYKFNALEDTPLQKGQVTAPGVALLGNNDTHLEPPVRFAITGGTGHYNTAHGKITEGVRGTPTEAERLPDIEL